MRIFNRIVLLAVSAFVVATVIPGTVSAQDPGWQFSTEVYLWGASVGGKTASGSDLDLDFSDILDNLEMGFMGFFGAQKGKWSLLADVIYLDVKKDTTVSDEPLSVELSGWIVMPAVAYNLVKTERVRLDVAGGARYLNLDLNLGLGPVREDASDTVWDGFVGVRGSFNLTEKWYLPFHLDVGTGDSDLSWQALGGIGYKFKRFDVLAAYRYLSWDFGKGAAIDDMNLSGPFAGIKLVF